MREKIISVLAKSADGMRQRDIASALGVWLCNSEFLKTIYTLEAEGKISSTIYSDPANMEYYKVWHIAAPLS